MPELPEVETMRRGILGIVGSRIADVVWPRCRKKPIAVRPRKDRFRRRAIDQPISAVDRLGKRVVIRLGSDDAIIIEPRMTGLVLVGEAPTAAHLRLRLDLAGGKIPSVWYWDRRGLGNVRLLSPEEFNSELGPQKIGPDALATTAAGLQAVLGHSRRAIKVALLDQRHVAGIGNLYASEILHLAEVDPTTSCDKLKTRHWQRIHAALVQVLELAIRYEGSTLSDGTYRNALNKSGGYQNEHRVYARVDQPCLRCGKSAIVRIIQAQRSTFYCPRCQR
jgi:formamidopyrimidine-DNA glycosylase